MSNTENDTLTAVKNIEGVTFTDTDYLNQRWNKGLDNQLHPRETVKYNHSSMR